MVKVALNKNTLFAVKLDLNLMNEILNLQHTFVRWRWNLRRFENQTANNFKVLKCIAEEDKLESSCEKWKSITKSQGRGGQPIYNETKEG